MTSANEIKLRSMPLPALLGAESCAAAMIGFIGRVRVVTPGPACASYLTGKTQKCGSVAAHGAKRKIGLPGEARSLGFVCRGPALTGERLTAGRFSP